MQLILTAIVVLLTLAAFVAGVFVLIAFAFNLGEDPVLSAEHCSQGSPAIPPTPKDRPFVAVPDDPEVVEDVMLIKDNSELQDNSDIVTEKRKARALARIKQKKNKDYTLKIIQS